MESVELDELLHSFDEKISNVCSKLAFLHLCSSQSRNESLEMHSLLGNIQFMLLNVNNFLQQQEELLQSQSKRCHNLFALLNDQSAHVESKLLLLNDKTIKHTQNKQDTQQIGIKSKDDKLRFAVKSSKETSKENNFNRSKTKAPSAKKISMSIPLPNGEKSLIPQMSLFTKDEFVSIPSYMLGRLTRDVLNDYVSAFNTTLREKYNFINSYSTQQSDADYKRFQDYKSHENLETKDLYFCTINDMKELSSMKNDSTIRKVFICFRHCKKVKEVRGNPSKLVRYALIN